LSVCSTTRQYARLTQLSAQLAFYGSLDFAPGEGARFPAIKLVLHSLSKYSAISQIV
jgi:hypothetical protein